tara:strand:- start:98 stop:280 length:183 start_codon:yes stop_codon:yes gene_type:complete
MTILTLLFYSTDKEVKDMTFQPTIFTAKDTHKKFRVDEKVEQLTEKFGSLHVERYVLMMS